MARIAMVVANRYDPDPRVQKEANSLVEAGHHVVVYAYDRQHELALHTILEGVEIQRLRVRRAVMDDLVSVGLGLRSFLQEVKRRLLADPPDVVHCHDQDTCSVGMWWKFVGARRVARAAGRKGGAGRFVFDAHDLYWTWLVMPDPRARWRQLGAAVLKARDRLYAGAADLLLTTTEGSAKCAGFAEIYRGWGYDPVVVWNAPRLPVVQAPLPQKFTVGYVGSVRELAMFEHLTRAIALLAPEERPAVRIAGGGRMQAAVSELLTRRSAELGFELKLSGTFRLDELSSIMAESSVQYCVYPLDRGNIDRALPVKLLDSVAHGRPVIGNTHTLMAEWIEQRRWGWTVAENDVLGLARILRLAQAAKLGADDLQPPPAWRAQGQILIAAYERLLQRTPKID